MSIIFRRFSSGSTISPFLKEAFKLSILSSTVMGNSNLLPDRECDPHNSTPVTVPEKHLALGTTTREPFPDDTEIVIFGMGCFWGAERKFWQTEGVFSTQVGYAGGYTINPTYHQVCSESTNHAEVVRVVFKPAQVSFRDLLKIFWESHDPTQGMRQGNDRGTQYRSCIYTDTEVHLREAEETKAKYQKELDKKFKGRITTEIRPAAETPFFYAEHYHQQYLYTNPGGYCSMRGTGVHCVD